MRVTPTPEEIVASNSERGRSNKQKGRARELKLRKILMAGGGVHFMKSQSSRGATDFAVAFPTMTLWVQAKSNGWESPAPIIIKGKETPSERALLGELAFLLDENAHLVVTLRLDTRHANGERRRVGLVRVRVHRAPGKWEDHHDLGGLLLALNGLGTLR